MLTTVAALVIVLGLMVSLARDVRSRSADRTTKDLLRQLDRLMAEYYKSHNQVLPPVTRLVETVTPSEPALRQRAAENNRQFLHAILRQGGLEKSDLAELPLWSAPDGARASQPQVDSGQDLTSMILDAWGGPIVFMPSQHPDIGMAPSDRYFFFSAGPDGRFLTREDNLYSYDTSSGELLPATQPAGASAR